MDLCEPEPLARESHGPSRVLGAVDSTSSGFGQVCGGSQLHNLHTWTSDRDSCL